jgi:hypothetical protein
MSSRETMDTDLAVRHSDRFRRVSTKYPSMVARAYDGDITAAEADSDGDVAARVAAWERAQGWEPRDWYAIGRGEWDPDFGE